MSISLTPGAFWVTDGVNAQGFEVVLSQGEIDRLVALERVLAWRHTAETEWLETDRGGWF